MEEIHILKEISPTQSYPPTNQKNNHPAHPAPFHPSYNYCFCAFSRPQPIIFQQQIFLPALT